jgi:hypothetical protein
MEIPRKSNIMPENRLKFMNIIIAMVKLPKIIIMRGKPLKI